MESLPFHLLELISKFVSRFSFDQTDLLAFAHVNKLWRVASERYRFENLQIQLQGTGKTNGIEGIEQAMSGHRRAWVRRLEITGGNDRASWCTTLKAQRDISQQDWIERADDSCQWYGKLDIIHSNAPLGPVESWAQIGGFIRSLQGLRDLIWHHAQQFPPELLAILHEELPRTRLHLHTFQLRSISQANGTTSATTPHEYIINQDEWDLIRSPNLHCIACYYTSSQQELAVMNMAGGVSPNLKLMQHDGSTITHKHLRWLPQPSFPWPEYLSSNSETSQGIDSLRLLLNASPDSSNWSVYTPGPANTLRAWELINLSRVRNLEIGCPGSTAVIQRLTIMAQGGAFQDLQSFSFGPFSCQNGADHDLTLSLFLEAIPPLKRLCLLGSVRSNDITFTTILTRHGKTLKTLCLDRGRHKPGLSSAEWIRKIGLLAEYCPGLEVLSLGIARSQGDESEVAVYRTLSWLRSLKHLRLLLDFSEFHVRRLEASKDGGGADSDEISLVRRPYVDFATTRACLINSAVDSKLALSIFNMVAMKNPNFRSLSVSVRGDWIWTERRANNVAGSVCFLAFPISRSGRPMFQQDQHMKELLKYVSNPWIVLRDIQGAVSVRQDDHLNADRASESSRGEKRLLKAFMGRDDLKKVWTSVWQVKPEGDGDYRRAWWSYPLSGVE